MKRILVYGATLVVLSSCSVAQDPAGLAAGAPSKSSETVAVDTAAPSSPVSQSPEALPSERSDEPSPEDLQTPTGDSPSATDDVDGGGSADVDEGGSADVDEGGSADVDEGGSPDVDEGGSPDEVRGEDPPTEEGGEAEIDDAAALVKCGITAEELSYVNRDWERVIGSVGREDHGEYTEAFTLRLASLVELSEGCAAEAELTVFAEGAEALNDAVGESLDDVTVYSQVAQSGNDWLDEFGVTSSSLAAG